MDTGTTESSQPAYPLEAGMPEDLDAGGEVWPSLPIEEWQDTCTTLHMWTQVVGKIRLSLTPAVNHWWHVPLYVTSRGLTTWPMPYGTNTFEIDFDFIDHELRITTSRGAARSVALAPRSVADFYKETMDVLRSLGIEPKIWTTPVEVANPIPFEQDNVHASYDREYAHRFWRILAQSERVLRQFRGRYLGKVSPVHFFWGSFDLALTRFSGRRAPRHPGVPLVADYVTEEAYSHEVSSCGFWPGQVGSGDAIFYSYAYPEPEGFKSSPAGPEGAFYSEDFGEFVLPYRVLRAAEAPDETLLNFAQATYEAAANNQGWDRASLERE